MKTTNTKIQAKKVNHVKPVSSSDSKFLILWNNENLKDVETEDINTVAISNSINLEKWKKKIGEKKNFIGIEVSKNFLIEDEYWREGILSLKKEG